MDKFTSFARRFTEAPAFEAAIIAIIIFNAILLGMDTSPAIDRDYGDWIRTAYQVALTIFIIEALLKMTASTPRVAGYFRDGWNIFDFLVIIFALIPVTGELAIIARLARLLRVLRLVSTIKDLRLIVTALIRSIPSVGHVLLLMSIIVYIYAIIGYHLFSEHDPENWRNLGISVLTLFNIITLEGWIEGHVHGDGTALACVDLLRHLRRDRHLRGHKPLHRYHHQQPRRGQARTPPGP